jgi:hypothetical protein
MIQSKLYWVPLYHASFQSLYLSLALSPCPAHDPKDERNTTSPKSTPTWPFFTPSLLLICVLSNRTLAYPPFGTGKPDQSTLAASGRRIPLFLRLLIHHHSPRNRKGGGLRECVPNYNSQLLQNFRPGDFERS